MFLASDVANTGEETSNAGTFLFIGCITTIWFYALYRATSCTKTEVNFNEAYSYKDLLLGEKPYGVSEVLWTKGVKSAKAMQFVGQREFSTFGTPWDERSVSKIINVLDKSDNVAICETKVETFRLMVESAKPALYYYNISNKANSDFIIGKLKIQQFNDSKADLFNTLLYEGFTYVNSSTYEKILLDHFYSCSCTLAPKIAAITIS